jgi:hypothetical protein
MRSDVFIGLPLGGNEADFIAHRHLSGSLGYSRIRNNWILQVSWSVVNRDWVKREREERGAVGLGARHAAKYSHGSIEALARPSGTLLARSSNPLRIG